MRVYTSELDASRRTRRVIAFSARALADHLSRGTVVADQRHRAGLYFCDYKKIWRSRLQPHNDDTSSIVHRVVVGYIQALLARAKCTWYCDNIFCTLFSAVSQNENF